MFFSEAHKNLKKCTEIKYTLTPYSVECARYVQITTIQTALVVKTLLYSILQKGNTIFILRCIVTHIYENRSRRYRQNINCTLLANPSYFLKYQF